MFDNVRPELFSVLAQQLHTADVLASHRIFMILFRTLKELSTKRLTADQKNFAEVCLLLHYHSLLLMSFILLHVVFVWTKAQVFALVKREIQLIMLADLIAILRL